MYIFILKLNLLNFQKLSALLMYMSTYGMAAFLFNTFRWPDALCF